MENDIKVYCHTTPNNKRYVGISRNPQKRWNSGRGYIKNFHFWRAIEKYGWDNIEHEILYDNLSIEEATEIEKKLIEEWNLTDRNCGYNLREGGSNSSFCDETIRRMSEAQKGNTNGANQIHTAENRKQISDSLKKYYKNHPELTLTPEEKREKKKLQAREWRKKHPGYYAKKRREKGIRSREEFSGANNPSAKAVIMCDLDGHEIKRYSYATLAANENNVDLSAIIKCCKGRLRTCGGFVWKYDNHQ